MGFIIFLVVGGIIFWLIIQSRKNVQSEWSRAASRLRLNYSGGLFSPHWIYGKKAGLRYDIKTFSRSTGSNANEKWTGYRVRFHRSADARIRVTQAARIQLNNRFRECEIDEAGIFCARPGIESDAPSIIDNVERLQSVTARLLAAAETEKAGTESPPPHIAPPQPIPDVTAPANEEPEETVVAISAADLEDESSPLEEPAESGAPDSEPEPEPEPVIELDESEPAGENEPVLERETDAEAKTKTKVHEVPEPLMTLTKVSGDLFDSGRNRFQITQRFDAEYNGLSMIGEGRLVRAEPYSNDRIFGRGPGTLAEVEIHRPEEPLSGHKEIRAVVQLPETTSARSLRGYFGDTVTISGTLLRCDAFDGRIFLGAGEIA